MIQLAALAGFMNPRNIAILGAVIIVGGLLWWGKGFVEEKFALEREVFAQTQQIQSMQAQQRILKSVAESEATANAVAQATLDAERERFAEFETTRRAILTAPAADDAPLAPVFEQALEALRARQRAATAPEDTE